MKRTKEQRDEIRAVAEMDYDSLEGGECYCTVHYPDLIALLDDADKAEALEKDRKRLNTCPDCGWYAIA